MTFVRLAMLALLALPLPATVAAQQPDIVVRDDVSRIEIERILTADNIDTSRLSPREVADIIAGIARGRAPDDFWAAYRAHADAWNRLADAVDAVRRRRSPSSFEGAEEVVKAEQAIETTFDEVERIARHYGARLPTPPWNILPTV